MKASITCNCFRIEESQWDKEYKESPWGLVYNLAINSTESGNEVIDFITSFASKVIKNISECPDIEFAREKIECSLEESLIEETVLSRPFCQGDEYIDTNWLRNAESKITDIFRNEISSYSGTAESYFALHSSAFKTANRLFFHLVENRENERMPFAFLATYANEKSRHTPLSSSLREYKNDQEKLIALLAPLSKIAEKSSFIKNLIDSGEIMKPIAVTAQEALSFLKEIPFYEECGVFCRIPNFWKNRTKHGFSAGILVGKKKNSIVGLETILDFEPQITLDGVRLTKAELSALLREAEGLRLIKGRWVEVNHDNLKALIAKADSYGNNGQIVLSDLLRRTMGFDENADPELHIEYGDYLVSLRDSLLHAKAKKNKLPGTVNAVLRPYQQTGYDYLVMMDSMKLGTCLADDMGLGKTLQVISLFANIMEKSNDESILVVVPTSLVGNWQNEIGKFIPNAKYTVLAESAAKSSKAEISNGIYITTYGLLGKLDNVKNHRWRVAVIDEAQAIKNSGTAQSKAVRALLADFRIAITGTPVENSAQDLWSLFDFINPGLLGTKTAFTKYLKSVTETEDYSRLRQTVSPFILRRMKTDKSTISDLPDKIEKKEYPALSKLQIKLYDSVVKELEAAIVAKEGIDRKGLVLSSIMKLKQICNHPDQYSGQSSDLYSMQSSGKFMMLADICADIRQRRERVLVFTQFREIIGALDNLLYSVFNVRGLTLDGSVSAKKRTELVKTFNGEEYCPYMILSLKAGGTGLNLTSANHVVHFDRWWNPAVENQATDRAFRIGQDKNVIVHRFITKGTIEEKIDVMLEKKRSVSDALLSSAGESWITELEDKEIIDICRFGGNT